MMHRLTTQLLPTDLHNFCRPSAFVNTRSSTCASHLHVPTMLLTCVLMSKPAGYLASSAIPFSALPFLPTPPLAALPP
jgi:hypothetical protein